MPESRPGRAIRGAVAPALRTIWWLARLMWPITLGIACLNHLGVIDWLSAGFAPLFERLGVPGRGSVVFLTSALSNPYAAIAVIATLGFDYRSVVILSVMSIICHNLIIESAVQQKTGTSGWAMALLRIGAALAAGAAMNLVLPEGMEGHLFLPAPEAVPDSWGAVLAGWLGTMGALTLRMGLIVLGLNIVQNLLWEYRLMERMSLPLRPLMAVMGLPRSTSFLWIIGNLVGLAYGGAALVEEVRRGEVSRGDARLLNTHLAISHSLLEDTSVFTSIGVGMVWLMVPRLVLALVAVWTLKLILRLHGEGCAGEADAPPMTK